MIMFRFLLILSLYLFIIMCLLYFWQLFMGILCSSLRNSHFRYNVDCFWTFNVKIHKMSSCKHSRRRAYTQTCKQHDIFLSKEFTMEPTILTTVNNCFIYGNSFDIFFPQQTKNNQETCKWGEFFVFIYL